MHGYNDQQNRLKLDKISTERIYFVNAYICTYFVDVSVRVSRIHSKKLYIGSISDQVLGYVENWLFFYDWSLLFPD